MGEIQQLLVTTTSHVTDQEAQALTDHGYSRDQYGWFFYAGGETHYVLPEIVRRSRGLFAVILCARVNACDYVLLDRDAETLPGVPTYDW
jgi:hypothetical protein